MTPTVLLLCRIGCFAAGCAFACFAIFGSGAVLAAGPVDVIYARPVAGDHRHDYTLQLLELALTKSGVPFRLAPSAESMVQSRSLAELEKGGEITVFWTMTSAEREARLQPVRIPIFKGLIGWRLLMIRAEDKERFARINSLADLRTLVAGQGHDWPDTTILRSAGFTVETGPSYNQFFPMLAARRFDWFPRSCSEIWAEVDAHAAEGLVVEPHLVIHYPAAVYFFVNRKNTQLAQMITKGLEAARRDGSFDRLFYKFHTPLFQRAQLKGRTVIELKNPLLPPETPLGNAALWYSP